MNQGQLTCVLMQALRVGGFFTRHAVASLVAVVAACVLLVITFIGLLIAASIMDAPLGHPCALPMFLLLFAIVTTGLCAIVFFPITAAAEMIAWRYKLSIIMQFPISLAFFTLLCPMGVGIAMATGASLTIQDASVTVGVLLLAGVLPLSLYWWTLQSVPLLLSFVRWLRSRREHDVQHHVGT